MDLFQFIEEDKQDNIVQIFLPSPTAETDVPVHVARSGVFKSDIDGLDRVDNIVVSRNDTDVYLYTGHILSQDEADILLSVLLIMQNSDNDTDGAIDELGRYKISKTAFLAKLGKGWTNTGQNHLRLEKALNRLALGQFRTESVDHSSQEEKRSKPMQMFSYEMHKDHLLLWIPVESMKLFEETGALSWSKRQLIESRSKLAKTLQLYMSGFPDQKHKQITLKELSVIAGVKSPERKFAVALEKAFNELKRVDVIDSYLIGKTNEIWVCSWTAN